MIVDCPKSPVPVLLPSVLPPPNKEVPKPVVAGWAVDCPKRDVAGLAPKRVPPPKAPVPVVVAVFC